MSEKEYGTTEASDFLSWDELAESLPQTVDIHSRESCPIQTAGNTNKPRFHMKDMQPSVLGVRAALTVFTTKFLTYQNDINTAAPDARRAVMEDAVAEAVVEVWRQGRIHQRDQDPDKLVELIRKGR